MFAISILALFQAQHAQGQTWNGETTRFWDCCKPACSWAENTGKVSQPVMTCAKNGVNGMPLGAKSACDGGDAYTCTSQQPWSVSDTLSYGFAASKSLAGMGPSQTCCACFLLTFTNQIVGKKMLVQVINTGVDLTRPNHFDVAMPGGGWGLNNACPKQWDRDGIWGKQWGGISFESECYNLPAALQPGCLWRFRWFKNADNPSMSIQRFRCPAELTSKTNCVRDDDVNYPYYNNGPGPVPNPGISWSSTVDGIWAFNCDFTGADLKSAKTTGEMCSNTCRNTAGCTHYTWTTFNGGTCWMKSGAAYKSDAVKTSDNSMVCGIMPWINWNGNNWALGCDFRGGDFKNIVTPSSNCGGACANTVGCTHFAWSTFNGGTCWMKQGGATKADAFSTYDKTMVCGVK